MEESVKTIKKKSKGTGNKLCPKCLAAKVRSRLELYQTTDTTAVYLCSSNECLFKHEIPRDYRLLQQLHDTGGDLQHDVKTAALKKWTVEGKQAVDAFRCPVSFEGSSPLEACAILAQAVGLLETVMGEDVVSCGARESEGHCPGDGQSNLYEQKVGADLVDSLVSDLAHLEKHKGTCCFANFTNKVAGELSQMESTLLRLGVDVSAYKRRVGEKYSAVDTNKLFETWLGTERCNFLDCHGVPRTIINLSGEDVTENGSGRALTNQQNDQQSDVIDTWLSEALPGHWDLNDSFTKLFQQEGDESDEVELGVDL